MVSVVGYHAGLPLVNGGYAGVDVFFVISGYLITTLLLKAQLDRSFSLSDFYIRRARRLFPALFAMLAVSTLISFYLLMPGELEDYGESLAGAAAFSSNFVFWREAGYFEGPSEFKPLLHTWSLAVEEQYYLLFPLLLLACRKSGRYLIVLCTVLLASLFISEWYVARSPAASFFLLPHRLWELMLGSVLAAINLLKPSWQQQLTNPVRETLGILGLLGILITVFGYSSSTQFPGVAALLPVGSTAALIVAGTGQSSTVSKVLSARGFIAVGLISYSLYLWHWPAFVFSKLYLIEPPSLSQTFAMLAVSFALAWFSWRFIELPFRNGGHKKGNKISEHSSTPVLTDNLVLPTSGVIIVGLVTCLLYTSPSPRDLSTSRMPSSA